MHNLNIACATQGNFVAVVLLETSIIHDRYHAHMNFGYSMNVMTYTVSVETPFIGLDAYNMYL